MKSEKWETNVLCELSYRFTQYVADFLERDRNLKRNFREETVTDLLMSALIGANPRYVIVEYPDETATGGDMEWVFVSPRDPLGGRYLKLIIQSKRAVQAIRKRTSYWCYPHLDHGDPAGSQARTLINYAVVNRGVVPIYMFYHPRSACDQTLDGSPCIEGINWTFADLIEPVIRNGCGLKDKKVDRWRNAFFDLGDIFCPDLMLSYPEEVKGGGSTQARMHPDWIAYRLNSLFGRSDTPDTHRAVPQDGIPQYIRRALNGASLPEDRDQLVRPRVIVLSKLKRLDWLPEIG